MSEKTSVYEVLVAVALGSAAIGGGWAAYQASQWGSSALEDFGKSSKTATEGATEFNYAIAVASRDADLDVMAKEHVLDAMSSQDEATKNKDTILAKYLYVQQMSPEAYKTLGYPDEFHSKEKEQQMPNDVLIAGLDKELDEAYFATVLQPSGEKFKEADTTFEEGDHLSSRSTDFGKSQMVFTISLFLGGLGLVVKSQMKWGFVAAAYGSIAWGTVLLFSTPWYHA